jgi:hypothetical protein
MPEFLYVRVVQQVCLSLREHAGKRLLQILICVSV